MPIAIPLTLLVLLAVLFGVFLWQNLEPTVALVFLGVVLPELPLALWILLALGVGIGLSLTFLVLLYISRGRSTKSGIAGAVSEAWDDEIGEQQANRTTGEAWDGDDDWSRKPQTVKAPDVDAEFRVITPPMRSLDDID
jgi:uncharacterized integral membrane protein